MKLTSALDLFADLYLSDIDAPNAFPDRLHHAGFNEVARKHSVDQDGSRITRLLFQRPDTQFAFSCLLSASGQVSDGAVILPDNPQNHARLLTFVKDQPNLAETTDETRAFLAFAPEDVSWSLVASRFWTSKGIGRTGVNFTLGPALLDFPDKPPDGAKGVALSASANIALSDPLRPDDIAQLTGPGSRLAKFVLIFAEIATKACPDLSKLIWAANAYGYDGDVAPSDTSFLLDGGNGPNPRSEDRTSAIHVNCQTDFSFEFALTFILDERLGADIIQSALFSALGVTPAIAQDGTARIQIGGDIYIVRHSIQSAAFGNHAFLLQR